MDEKVKELSLLLLYLTGWEEDVKNEPGMKQFKTWTGYLFEVLKQLEGEGKIKRSHNLKVLFVLPKGIDKARELKEKYLGGK